MAEFKPGDRVAVSVDADHWSAGFKGTVIEPFKADNSTYTVGVQLDDDPPGYPIGYRESELTKVQ